MQKKVRENFVYALEEDWERLKTPVLWAVCILFVWGGVSFVFHKIDDAMSAVEIKGYETEVFVPVFEDVISDETKIFIPKIEVEAPISFVKSTNPSDFIAPLKNGVTHYPSALPGEKGVSVILGHSAPAGILRKGFNGVFSDLKDLAEGDEIIVQYERNMFRYVVENQEVLQKGQDVPQGSLAAGESKLILLSCWPPGIDNKRIMVIAKAL